MLPKVIIKLATHFVNNKNAYFDMQIKLFVVALLDLFSYLNNIKLKFNSQLIKRK